MNHVLKIDGDIEVMTKLSSLVETGILTPEEKEHCILTNSVTSETIELIARRIEITRSSFKKCKIDQFLIFSRMPKFTLHN